MPRLTSFGNESPDAPRVGYDGYDTIEVFESKQVQFWKSIVTHRYVLKSDGVVVGDAEFVNSKPGVFQMEGRQYVVTRNSLDTRYTSGASLTISGGDPPRVVSRAMTNGLAQPVVSIRDLNTLDAPIVKEVLRSLLKVGMVGVVKAKPWSGTDSERKLHARIYVRSDFSGQNRDLLIANALLLSKYHEWYGIIVT